MKAVCFECRGIQEFNELKDRQKKKCPKCGCKGTYVPHVEGQRETILEKYGEYVDGVLM